MFKYTPDSRELINFFPTMHKYTKPEVIIVDFMHTFFDDFAALDTNDQLQLSFMDAHMLMAGALHAAADGLSPGPDKKIISIICIDPQYHSIYQRFIQIFVDSYFFKEGAILSIEQMMQRFSWKLECNAILAIRKLNTCLFHKIFTHRLFFKYQ